MATVFMSKLHKPYTIASNETDALVLAAQAGILILYYPFKTIHPQRS